MYLNKALVYGNLTRDPELRSLPSGTQVTTFSIATNRVWKDKDGAKQESPEFHNIVVFGRQAETTAQYLKKGSSALIEGRMQTRSWESDGVKKYRTEIVADRVQFGPRSGGSGASGTGASQSAPAKSDSPASDIEYPQEDIKPEDIPF
ncbi:MAG: single-stranded DNA-binding protein [Candidatus Pacebacteria bacterium]|jgi:single-strand DNA-binding protein|nr:single-stranded DNA-binding protein [Parcubacteria group bacterium]MDP6249583.1 single-stranded DNA-binding protein [Candidatus Paceibacterota bacterium]MDP7158993.1 single-stranded DNA-binding protein [Candidatus Paceibacterota bacterium]MDP7366571.1 single-stranded DNA-binding protein [Candidatus Paceibacterota bacterium]MDP7466433.1 single-stranded DNA-binding protein [Candidatus Paceibacterota bacterium]|tara:strand:+ start:1031 stop:1474 length:444 start_codon:yes stop_codon:yes gene_type:complete